MLIRWASCYKLTRDACVLICLNITSLCQNVRPGMLTSVGPRASVSSVGPRASGISVGPTASVTSVGSRASVTSVGHRASVTSVGHYDVRGTRQAIYV